MQIRKTVRTSYSFLQKVQRFCMLLYYKILRIQATPESISRGLAAGVFVGMLPLLPVQTFCAVLLAYLIKGSKIAAAAGTWVSNPLNWVPLYLTFYYLGRKIYHFVNSTILGNVELPFSVPSLDLDHINFVELMDKGPKMLFIMFVGALLLAIPSALVSYFVSVKSIRLYQKNKKARLMKKIKMIEREVLKKLHEEQHKESD